MAYLLEGERLRLHAPRFALTRLHHWLTAAHKRRREQLALREMLELDSRLLADIGLTRADLVGRTNPSRRPPA
jgi:uncharacterized protein YjiS (DUF1127 family)